MRATEKFQGWLSAVPGRVDRRVFVASFGVLLVVFSATASWSVATNDPLTNAISGWYLGNEGTPILDQHEALYDYRNTAAWVVESPRGPVSQYPPGAALVAAGAYAVTPGDLRPVEVHLARLDETITFLQPPIWPATMTAVLVTSLACASLAVACQSLSRRPWEAVFAGLLTGVATGAWSVASNMSWTHGPGMLAVAGAALAAARGRWWLAGAAVGAGILVRPHLAVVAAALGVVVAVSRRDVRPAIAVGVPSAGGLGLLLLYNRWLWGAWTISGGYGTEFASRLVGSDPGDFARNVVLGLVSPVNGVLIWAPYLLLLVPAAVLVRRVAPDWTIAMAIGGIAYLLVQWKANRYTGGSGFFAYRYPIETLAAMAPMLFVGWDRWARGRPVAERLLRLLFLLAIAGQAVGAVLS